MSEKVNKKSSNLLKQIWNKWPGNETIEELLELHYKSNQQGGKKDGTRI